MGLLLRGGSFSSLVPMCNCYQGDKLQEAEYSQLLWSGLSSSSTSSNGSSRFLSVDSRTIQSTRRHGGVRGGHMCSAHSSRESNRQPLAPAEWRWMAIYITLIKMSPQGWKSHTIWIYVMYPSPWEESLVTVGGWVVVWSCISVGNVKKNIFHYKVKQIPLF